MYMYPTCVRAAPHGARGRTGKGRGQVGVLLGQTTEPPRVGASLRRFVRVSLKTKAEPRSKTHTQEGKKKQAMRTIAYLDRNSKKKTMKSL